MLKLSSKIISGILSLVIFTSGLCIAKPAHAFSLNESNAHHHEIKNDHNENKLNPKHHSESNKHDENINCCHDEHTIDKIILSTNHQVQTLNFTTDFSNQYAYTYEKNNFYIKYLHNYIEPHSPPYYSKRKVSEIFSTRLLL